MDGNILAADASLSKLREVKRAWLEEAESAGVLEACRETARELGERLEMRHWEHYRFWRWQDGEVIVYLSEGSNRYVPDLNCGNHVSTLRVEAGGRAVCYHRVMDDAPNALFGESEPDNFFVPGKWVNRILKRAEFVRERRKAQLHASQERERAALLEQLLVGKEV